MFLFPHQPWKRVLVNCNISELLNSLLDWGGHGCVGLTTGKDHKNKEEFRGGTNFEEKKNTKHSQDKTDIYVASLKKTNLNCDVLTNFDSGDGLKQEF